MEPERQRATLTSQTRGPAAPATGAVFMTPACGRRLRNYCLCFKEASVHDEKSKEINQNKSHFPLSCVRSVDGHTFRTQKRRHTSCPRPPRSPAALPGF